MENKKEFGVVSVYHDNIEHTGKRIMNEYDDYCRRFEDFKIEVAHDQFEAVLKYLDLLSASKEMMDRVKRGALPFTIVKNAALLELIAKPRIKVYTGFHEETYGADCVCVFVHDKLSIVGLSDIVIYALMVWTSGKFVIPGTDCSESVNDKYEDNEQKSVIEETRRSLYVGDQVGVYFPIIYSGYSLYKSGKKFKKGETSGKQMAKELTETTAAVTGGTLGCTTGAYAGAAIGSVVPGFGTTVGGIVGFIGGGILGSTIGRFGSRKALDTLAESDYDRMMELFVSVFCRVLGDFAVTEDEAKGFSEVFKEELGSSRTRMEEFMKNVYHAKYERKREIQDEIANKNRKMRKNKGKNDEIDVIGDAREKFCEKEITRVLIAFLKENRCEIEIPSDLSSVHSIKQKKEQKEEEEGENEEGDNM